MSRRSCTERERPQWWPALNAVDLFCRVMARFRRDYRLPSDELIAALADSTAARRFVVVNDECRTLLALAHETADQLRPLAQLQRCGGADSAQTHTLFVRLVESGALLFPADVIFASPGRRRARIRQAVAQALHSQPTAVTALVLELHQAARRPSNGASFGSVSSGALHR